MYFFGLEIWKQKCTMVVHGKYNHGITRTRYKWNVSIVIGFFFSVVFILLIYFCSACLHAPPQQRIYCAYLHFSFPPLDFLVVSLSVSLFPLSLTLSYKYPSPYLYCPSLLSFLFPTLIQAHFHSFSLLWLINLNKLSHIARHLFLEIFAWQ